MTRILVIDDEVPVRRVLRKILTEAGYEVDEAPDGQAGLDRYRAQPADLVLTDLFMPGMHGMELIRQLAHEFPEAQVVALSGGAGRADPRKLLPLVARFGSVAATLQKPFGRYEVLEVVRQVLG